MSEMKSVENFCNDVKAYISSLCPDLPEWAALQIATYAANRLTVTMSNIIIERDKKWENKMKTDYSELYKTVEKVRKNYYDRKDGMDSHGNVR